MAIKIKIKEVAKRYFELTYYSGSKYGLDKSLWQKLCFNEEIELESIPEGLENKVDIIT